MSPWQHSFFWIFLAFYFTHEAVLVALDVINYLHTRKQKGPPEFLREAIPPATFEKSKAYSLDKLRFGLFTHLVQIPFFWLLIFANGFNALDYYAMNLGGYGTLTHAVLFCVFLGIYFGVVSLPFKVYSIFVVEERHGFNKITPALFVQDLLKAACLSLALGVPLLYAIFWFMQSSGAFWWLFVWLTLTVFQIFVAAVYPTWLAPFFNKFSPLHDEILHQRIRNIAQSVGFKMAGVFTIDGSKRSAHSNAYFAGLGNQRRIVLFDTLLKQLDHDELTAVLAHEMGHSIKRHILKSVILSSLLSLAGFYILSLLMKWESFYGAFGIMFPSPHTALAIFALISDVFTFALTPLMNLWSRKNEYEADHFAVIALQNGAPLKSALLKLTRENLSPLAPHKAYSFYHYSHPTLEERWRKIDSSKV